MDNRATNRCFYKSVLMGNFECPYLAERMGVAGLLSLPDHRAFSTQTTYDVVSVVNNGSKMATLAHSAHHIHPNSLPVASRGGCEGECDGPGHSAWGEYPTREISEKCK